MCRSQTFGPDRRAKTVLGAVGDFQCFIVCAERNYRHHRTKDFFRHRFGCYIAEERWAVEVSFSFNAFSAGNQCSFLLVQDFENRIRNSPKLVFIVQRPHLVSKHPVSDRELFNPFLCGRDELCFQRFVYQNTFCRRTHLSAIIEAVTDSRGGGTFYIRGFGDDKSIISAKFEMNPFQISAGRSSDLAACRG